MNVSKLSKRMSYLLRHHPEVGGLTLDAEGWIPVPELLDSIGMSFEELEVVVAQNDKQRFELDSKNGRIRARQGHSVPVELGLEPVVAPAVLYHGTVRSALPQIFEMGLLPMSRQFVHLSSTVAIALDVAGRRGRGEAVILEVDAAGLATAGIDLLCSSNGVFLTEHVPAGLLSIAE